MAPKKSVEAEVLFGRPGNHLKMGIVGLPNVGKSTLFNLMTKMSVPAENYAFCTLEPNVSRVEVPDERYDWLCEHYKPASKVPTYLHVTDIAGLVRGAHEGQGLGNAFLSHIRAVDGIFHVTRIFEDTDISHVEESIDPVRDLEIISEELRMKDIDLLTKEVDNLTKISERIDKTKKVDLEIVKKALELVKDGTDIRNGTWAGKEIEVLNPYQLLTAKPVVFIINMSPKDYIRKKNKWLLKIKQWVDEHGKGPIIPVSAAFEQELMDLQGDEERKAFLAEKKTTSNLNKIVKTGYHSLKLIHFFTCGADEVRCWTVRKGSLAPKAAGTIHTDFEKGFIMAEVMSYDDLKENGSDAACKAAGKYRQQGRNYEVKDGDIMYIKAGQVNSGKKK